MSKYYRVRKDTFLWKEGAILTESERNNFNGYEPIEDVWDNTPVNAEEYISARIVEHENNAEYFERVYKDTICGALFRTADQLKQTYKESFK